MNDGIRMESGLEGLAGQIAGLCERLSEVSHTLTRIRAEMKDIWQDEFHEDYIQQYDRGLDAIDGFLVTLDTTETYLRQVYSGYIEIDHHY